MISLKYFLAALQFLTVIKVAKKLEVTDEDLSRSMVFFPLIGLLIGGVQVLIFLAFFKIVSPLVVALFLLLTLVGITGALHLEGFADMVDGFVGGKDKDEILRIMKDSHIGAMGVIGAVCLLLVKFVFLVEILSSLNPPQIVSVLLLIPSLSRWAMVIETGISQYARSTPGVASPFTQGVGKKIVYLSGFLPLMVCILFLQGNGIIFFAVSILVTLLLSQISKRRIGGVTGDVLGSTNELVEVILLLCAVALGGSYV